MCVCVCEGWVTYRTTCLRAGRSECQDQTTLNLKTKPSTPPQGTQSNDLGLASSFMVHLCVKSVTVSPSICYEVMGLDAMLLVF